MISWKLIDATQIPGNGGELQLRQHNGDFSINIAGGGILMDTRTHESEEALAELACSKISDRSRVRVLVGGLGMGFTLAAALRNLGPDAEVVVAELVPKVVAWNRIYLGVYSGYPLEDERTLVRESDVAKVIKEKRQAFDAILLDVDNGPEGLTRKKNDWLYTIDGLIAAFEALRPKGMLAVWSASPDGNFTERLQKVGFYVQQTKVRAHHNIDERHTIWFAEAHH